ncbi:MAG: hypothetical protein DRI99_02340 [Candidatus Aminicenantes bacterium]|nr:MAG: hypothetical protein DRI99_02340 [Candidatus Aminicenantes bacterium]
MKHSGKFPRSFLFWGLFLLLIIVVINPHWGWGQLQENRTGKNLGVARNSLLGELATRGKTSISGQEILKMVDNRSVGEEAPSDLQAKMVMRIIDARQNEKKRELRVWSKNRPGEDDWRVMKFLSPPDVRGVGFLVLADDQMYLYLPEFRRIRRIASHNKSERFMGSDFSYEDLSTGGLAKYYQATLVEENSTTWHLELVLKPGADKPYPRIEMWVDKETHLPRRYLLYDKSGEPWKEASQKVKQIEGYWLPVETVMKDLKAQTRTILTMEEIKVNTGLKDNIFTQRFLKRRVR